MFERNYYTLIAGLPDITLEDTKLSYTTAEFKSELREFVHPADFELIEIIFLKYDNQNLINLLVNKEDYFNELGNYNREFLEEEIKNPENLLPYFIQFINAYKEKQKIFKGFSWENQLHALFYDYTNTLKNKFLVKWFQFELEIKNITSALNCRKYNVCLSNQVIGDNEIAEAIKKKTTKDFGLGKDVDYIEKLITTKDTADLLMQEKAIDHLKWDWLDDESFFYYFTIERIITYVLKIEMVERWMELDPETGKEMFNKLRNNLERGYEFPEVFKVRKVKR